MPEPQQIMKLRPIFKTCDTYNCLKKAAYAIGRPDGPMQLWSYFCEDCMRSIVASVPEELRPEPELTDDTRGEYGDPEPEAKAYACKYCGEEFDVPAKMANHTRYCEARKEG